MGGYLKTTGIETVRVALIAWIAFSVVPRLETAWPEADPVLLYLLGALVAAIPVVGLWMLLFARARIDVVWTRDDSAELHHLDAPRRRPRQGLDVRLQLVGRDAVRARVGGASVAGAELAETELRCAPPGQRAWSCGDAAAPAASHSVGASVAHSGRGTGRTM